MRPCQPRGFVGLPLRGKKEAFAGHRYSWRSIEEALNERSIGVDPPIAQEGPAAAHGSMQSRSTSTVTMASASCGLGPGSAQRARPGTSCPRIRCRCPGPTKAFPGHAVHRGHEDTVGNGMRPLHSDPCLPLGSTQERLFLRMPTDGRGIQEDSAPAMAVKRAASGNHWSQQIKIPSRPQGVGTARKPRSPGVK